MTPPDPRERRNLTPASRAAGVSFVLLMVLTGTVAAVGPASLATEGGRRSAAMLMATLQDAARRLADAEEAEAPRTRPAPVAPAPTLAVLPQTPDHTDPPRPALCVLPPPAA